MLFLIAFASHPPSLLMPLRIFGKILHHLSDFLDNSIYALFARHNVRKQVYRACDIGKKLLCYRVFQPVDTPSAFVKLSSNAQSF